MKVSINRVAVAVVGLWLVAAGMLAYDTLQDGMTEVGRWAMFASAAAVTATICYSLQRCRRVILEVMSWEHWMLREQRDQQKSEHSNVHAIR